MYLVNIICLCFGYRYSPLDFAVHRAQNLEETQEEEHMTKEQEALNQALEALESALSDDQPYIVKCGEAITAIKEALAQPEIRPDEISTDELIYMSGRYDGMKQERPWVGLTEDDVNNALYKYHGWREFAAELERLLKEKNYG
jgi:DNA gyrase/topoisomerase IV subunit A